MSQRMFRIGSSFAVAVALAALAASAVWAQSHAPAEKFIANAINISEVGRPGAGQVEIVIDRWTPEAERERLVSTLLDQGPEALLKALQKTLKVGYIRTPGSIGYDLHFAYQTPADEGGRRVVIATDRPIGFWEATNQPRSINYPFTVIELRLDRDGKGEGKLSLATRITGDKRTKTIQLEDYATQPVMLKEVRPQR